MSGTGEAGRPGVFHLSPVRGEYRRSRRGGLTWRDLGSCYPFHPFGVPLPWRGSRDRGPERGAQRTTQAGFTLIEMLVVMAITALVALIGFPQMQQALLSLSQRQAVAVVAARLRLARAQALRADGPVAFAVAPDGAAYGVIGGVATPAPPGVTVRIQQAAAANGRIIFYGDGSASGGAVAISAGRRTLRVMVTAGAGAVAVQGG